MVYRPSALSYILILTLVPLVLLSGCSSQPNPELNLGGIDVGAVFDGMVSRVYQVVGGVNSLDSADKAVPALEAISMDFDDLIFNSQKMSPAGQTALSVRALKAAPDMEALISQVKRSPIMAKKLGEPLDDILKKMMGLI